MTGLHNNIKHYDTKSTYKCTEKNPLTTHKIDLTFEYSSMAVIIHSLQEGGLVSSQCIASPLLPSSTLLSLSSKIIRVIIFKY